MKTTDGYPPSLPGLTWDPAKGRYFQIQKSGTEDTTRSEYSLRNVRLRDVEREAQEQKVKRRRLAEAQSIKRERTLEQLTGFLHRREFDHQVSTRLTQSLFATFRRSNPSQYTIPAAFGEYGSHGDNQFKSRESLQDFLYDEIQERFYFFTEQHVNNESYSLRCLERKYSVSSTPKTPSKFSDLWQSSELLAVPCSQLMKAPNIHHIQEDSLSIIHESGIFDVTTPNKNERTEVKFTPTPSGVQTCAQNSFTSTHKDWIIASQGNGVIQKRTQTAAFTFRGILPQEPDIQDYWTPIHHVGRKSRISILEWIQPEVFVFNNRRIVQLFDRRLGQKGGTPFASFKHPSTPLRVTRADVSGNTLIVTGLNSHMCLYDIRYIDKLKSPSVFSFEWSNELDERLGLDVSFDFSIVAASQDNHSIGIYCSKTGKTLQRLQAEPDPLRNATYRQFGKIQILEKQPSALRILSNYGGDLIEFGLD